MEGSTRSKASSARPPWAGGSVNGPTASSISTTEPGQPCVMINGIASGCGDRTWMKWMSTPSISVMNCGRAFSRASQRRQSYSVAQYRHSASIEASCTPCERSVTSSREGHRVAVSRRRSSPSASSGISARNGRMALPVCWSTAVMAGICLCSRTAEVRRRPAARTRGGPVAPRPVAASGTAASLAPGPHAAQGPPARCGKSAADRRSSGTVWHRCGSLAVVLKRRVPRLLVSGFLLVVAVAGLSACRTSPNVAAYVGDEQITVATLDSAVDERLADKDIAAYAKGKEAEFTRRVLSLLVQEKVYEAAAEHFGVEVADDAVRARIAELLGTDDPDTVYQQLAQQGISRADVFENVRQQLLRLKVAAAKGKAQGLDDAALQARYQQV